MKTFVKCSKCFNEFAMIRRNNYTLDKRTKAYCVKCQRATIPLDEWTAEVKK